MLYLNLAKRLPAEFSVYGVTPLRRGDIALSHMSVPEMATCYVEHVRQLQPEGPYHLAGLCAGGVLAFEMARQLEHAGERVELLGILDAGEPSSPRKRFVVARQRIESMANRWRSDGRARGAAAAAAGADAAPCARRRDVLESLRQTTRATRNLLVHEATAFARAVSIGLRFRLLQQVQARGMAWPAAVAPLKVREIYSILRDQYVPDQTGVRGALLIRAQPHGVGREEPASTTYADPQLGWRRHVRGELRVLDAPGGHSSMLQEPAVEFIVEAFASYLAAGAEPAAVARLQVAGETQLAAESSR